MPWKETCVMDERVRFIGDWLSGDFTKGLLCAAYGISRPTGDKWISRYEQEGLEGLKERSCAPHRHPNVTPAWQLQRIVELRSARPWFGPKKIIDYLKRTEPELRWPADSTAGDILKRAGLVKARRRRRSIAPDTQPFHQCDRANQVWSADFKGQFRMGDGRWCYPLTVTDNYSRYLLVCRGLPQTRGALARPWFERVFREWGLPTALRTDNGAPFASRALGGLSALSKWWIRLGIKPERIEPGKPNQNGRHERMHRSLKAATQRPAKHSLSAQQRVFNRFVHEYNEERSHEALGRNVPAQFHEHSPKAYPSRLEPIEYPRDFTIRSVRHSGEIKWKGQFIYVSEVLAKERIGLYPIDNGRWNVYFSFYKLGTFDERIQKIVPCQYWHGTPKENVN